MHRFMPSAFCIAAQNAHAQLRSEAAQAMELRRPVLNTRLARL